MANFAAYERSVDCGNGKQIVLVSDEKIVEQRLIARQGYYTGDGNPEIIGQPVSAIRGWGFKRIRNETKHYEMEMDWMQREIEEAELTASHKP